MYMRGGAERNLFGIRYLNIMMATRRHRSDCLAQKSGAFRLITFSMHSVSIRMNVCILHSLLFRLSGRMWNTAPDEYGIFMQSNKTLHCRITFSQEIKSNCHFHLLARNLYAYENKKQKNRKIYQLPAISQSKSERCDFRMQFISATNPLLLHPVESI